MSIEDIAGRFGVTPMVVRQCLKLGESPSRAGRTIEDEVGRECRDG
jgi:hypothetical protein